MVQITVKKLTKVTQRCRGEQKYEAGAGEMKQPSCNDFYIYIGKNDTWHEIGQTRCSKSGGAPAKGGPASLPGIEPWPSNRRRRFQRISRFAPSVPPPTRWR